MGGINQSVKSTRTFESLLRKSERQLFTRSKLFTPTPWRQILLVTTIYHLLIHFMAHGYKQNLRRCVTVERSGRKRRGRSGAKRLCHYSRLWVVDLVIGFLIFFLSTHFLLKKSVLYSCSQLLLKESSLKILTKFTN